MTLNCWRCHRDSPSDSLSDSPGDSPGGSPSGSPGGSPGGSLSGSLSGSPGDEAACPWCGVWVVDLDPARVPAPLRPLLTPARRWGIADDVFRVDALEDATPVELGGLLDAVDSVDAGAVDAWLCGPEADAGEPTNEYVAVSALMMTAELARLRLDPW